MDTAGRRSRLLATHDESICRDAAIEFVVVFGSQVSGGSRQSSDLDLAVKFDEELSSHERFETWCYLSGDLQRADTPFVDLSDIERLPVEVAHDAVNGEFLCGDEQAFHRFKAQVEATFEDRRDEIRRRQRAVIDRIAEEGLRD